MSKVTSEGRPLRILQCGLGPLGLMGLECLGERTGFQLVGAVDRAEHMVGHKLAEFLQHPVAGDIVIESDLAAAVQRLKPDVCVVMTVSDLKRVESQIVDILNGGAHVVSTCEELSFPWVRDPDFSARIDKLAREKERVVLGTGINPGFLMDSLPQSLTAVCHRVESVLVERFQDASFRRLPFQRKIGAGLSLSEFAQKKAEGTLRHVGLEESMHLIAAKLGWQLDRTEDVIEPVVAEETWQGKELSVPAGDALGVLQTGRGFMQGKQVVTLVFHAAVGTANPRDRVVIEGKPSVDMTIAGGVHGDIATCSIVLNACHAVTRATAGLQHMGSIPSVCWRA